MIRKSILCVDDESVILQSLKRELEQFVSEDLSIETAGSGEEAMELLSELMDEGIHIPVVVIDYIMPGLKGDELARKIHNISPGTRIIMLSGQVTIEGVTNAINNGNLYRYIEKPWDRKELENAILKGMEIYLDNVRSQQKIDALESMNEVLKDQFLDGMTKVKTLMDKF